jgi:hypothetical protein
LFVGNERKNVFSCYWRDDGVDGYGCFALVGGGAYDVTPRLDEVDASDEALIFRCTP